MNSLVDNQTVKTLSNPMAGVEPADVSHKPRIANIEHLRIVSVCAVVSFHTHKWFPDSLCFVGLIILLLCSCAFVVNKPEAYGLVDLTKRKARRLMLPWVFWSVVYGGIGLAKMIIRDMSFSEVFSPVMLLTGTRIHLWYLPFVFVAAMFIGFVHLWIVNIPERFKIVPAILIGALSVLTLSIMQYYVNLWVPLAQWALGIPAITLGFALGRIMLVQDARHRRNYYLFATLSTVAASAIACVVIVGLAHEMYLCYGIIYAMRYGIAVVIICSALYWKGHLNVISRDMVSLSYGIYLIHPLVIVVLSQLRIAEQHPLVLLFLVLSVSSLITHIMRKTPLKLFV